MRRALLLSIAALAACGAVERPFPVGLVGPVSSSLAAEAARLGLIVVDSAPSGSAVSGVVTSRDGLRLAAARAAVAGASGFFVRPGSPEGRDLLDYPEEWQAPSRVLRELSALRPVLEGGALVALPFPVPAGLEARAWRFGGRVYVVLANPTAGAVRLDAERLAGWRALFSERADAARALGVEVGPCQLGPGRALWLEGRLL